MTELFLLTAGLAGLMFALLLGLFLVAAFNVLFLEPGSALRARWRARRAKRSHDKARAVKSRQSRYYTPTPRLRRRPK